MSEAQNVGQVGAEVLTEEQIGLVIQQARREWLSQYASAPLITKMTQERLDREYLSVVTKLFENEHNRGSYSTVGRFLSDTIRNAVNEWVTNNRDQMPKLDSDTIENLKQHYLTTYHLVLKEELARLAKERAREDGNNMLEKLWEANNAAI